MPIRIGQGTTISIGAAATGAQVGEIVGMETGIIVEIEMFIPNTTNNVTFTFAILNPDSRTKYSVSGLVEDALYVIPISRAIRKGSKFSLTPSGVTGNDISVTILPAYEV